VVVLSALVLSFIVQMPGTININESIQADARYGWNCIGGSWFETVDGYGPWWQKQPFGEKINPPSAQFNMCISIAMMFNAASLVCAIVM
jgi:hypothetical protein